MILMQGQVLSSDSQIQNIKHGDRPFAHASIIAAAAAADTRKEGWKEGKSAVHTIFRHPFLNDENSISEQSSTITTCSVHH